MQTSPLILAYSAAGRDEGIVVERDDHGVTVIVSPLARRRRLVLAVATTAAAMVGPLAAVIMIAARVPGGVVPFAVLGVILAPALLLRWLAADPEPGDGAEAVFRLDERHLHLTVHTRAGPRISTWPRGEVEFRRSWLGTGLAVRVRGTVVAELLHGHPLRVRARVAAALAEAHSSCPTR